MSSGSSESRGSLSSAIQVVNRAPAISEPESVSGTEPPKALLVTAMSVDDGPDRSRRLNQVVGRLEPRISIRRLVVKRIDAGTEPQRLLAAGVARSFSPLYPMTPAVAT